MFADRKYYIIDVTETNKVEFDSILIKESQRLRKSLDSTKCILTIEGPPKGFLSTINSLEGPYTHDQMKVIIKQPEWSK